MIASAVPLRTPRVNQWPDNCSAPTTWSSSSDRSLYEGTGREGQDGASGTASRLRGHRVRLRGQRHDGDVLHRRQAVPTPGRTLRPKGGRSSVRRASAREGPGMELVGDVHRLRSRSEEHTSELQSHSFISY